ncbi:MAG: DUF995 domain-containing protein [Desulfotalea sp.]
MKLSAKILTTISVITFCMVNISNVYASDRITTLKADEVRALYSGKTISGKNHISNKVFTIVYNNDGTYKGTISDGQRKTSGTWEVKEDGTLCTKGRKQRARVNCGYVIKDGNNYVTFQKTSTFQVK